MIYFLSLAACAAAAYAAFAARRHRDQAAAIEARAVASRIVAEARARGAKIIQESAAKADAVRTAKAAALESELKSLRAELADRSALLEARQEKVQAREDRHREHQSAVARLRGGLDAATARTRALGSEITTTCELTIERLEKLAGTPRTDVVAERSQALVDALQHDLAKQNHRVLADTEEEKERLAKRVIDNALLRYQDRFPHPKMVSTFELANPQVRDALLANDHKLLQLIAETAHIGIDVSEDGNSVSLTSQNSFGREVGRRALAVAFKDHRLSTDRLAGQLKRIQREMEREVKDAALKACQVLEIGRLHPEIGDLVGRLKYRTSYSQNQWQHAVEVAYICGLMASELGLDTRQARRAGLLHDIGKAIDHEIEGSHAVIGADYARRLGEAEIVANAIGSHHNDEPPRSALAHIVAAGDALSGARPGARVEVEDQYFDRIHDLERIAMSQPGVRKAYALQAGREVRVYVDADKVDDRKAVMLSRDLAAQIEEDLTYPGQIQVVVIREVIASACAA